MWGIKISTWECHVLCHKRRWGALCAATMHLTFSLESKGKDQLVNFRLMFSSFWIKKSYLFWRSQIWTFQREHVENHFEEESGPGITKLQFELRSFASKCLSYHSKALSSLSRKAPERMRSGKVLIVRKSFHLYWKIPTHVLDLSWIMAEENLVNESKKFKTFRENLRKFHRDIMGLFVMARI